MIGAMRPLNYIMYAIICRISIWKANLFATSALNWKYSNETYPRTRLINSECWFSPNCERARPHQFISIVRVKLDEIRNYNCTDAVKYIFNDGWLCTDLAGEWDVLRNGFANEYNTVKNWVTGIFELYEFFIFNFILGCSWISPL